MKQSKGPRVLECYFFSYSQWPWQLQGHFCFNFRASGNKVWNKSPSPFYFLHHCLFLHKKSSAMAAFPRSSPDTASGEEFPICLCCLTLLLWVSLKHLLIMPPTYLSSPNLILGLVSAITMTLIDLTQSLIHVKTFRDSPSDVCHQFKWQPELPKFANTRVLFYTPTIFS